MYLILVHILKIYDIDAVINKLNKGKITIDGLYDGMA